MRRENHAAAHPDQQLGATVCKTEPGFTEIGANDRFDRLVPLRWAGGTQLAARAKSEM